MNSNDISYPQYSRFLLSPESYSEQGERSETSKFFSVSSLLGKDVPRKPLLSYFERLSESQRIPVSFLQLVLVSLSRSW